MNKLREKRNKAGLTAFVLGNLAGVHELRIYTLERERVPPREGEAGRLAAVLNTTAGKLFPEHYSDEPKGGAK
ncbi:MAG: helix-turn-helix transcriptional regulator [bacterium]